VRGFLIRQYKELRAKYLFTKSKYGLDHAVKVVVEPAFFGWGHGFKLVIETGYEIADVRKTVALDVIEGMDHIADLLR